MKGKGDGKVISIRRLGGVRGLVAEDTGAIPPIPPPSIVKVVNGTGDVNDNVKGIKRDALIWCE